MKESGLSFSVTIFILTALNMFSIIILILPFFAQETQEFSPNLYVNLYLDHLQLYSITCSVLLSILITYVIKKKSSTIKIRLFTICTQLLLLVFLSLVIYYNLNYLDELILSPTYE